MLASLAMLLRQGALRVAAGGSAPPIPCVARRGLGAARSGRESSLPIEPESRICEVAARTMVSRSGLRVTAPIGVSCLLVDRVAGDENGAILPGMTLCRGDEVAPENWTGS